MALTCPRAALALLVIVCMSSVLAQDTETPSESAGIFRRCPLRKISYRILNCYYRFRFPIICGVIRASLALCNVYPCGRGIRSRNPETCYRRRCPTGLREQSSAVCGRREVCCYSTATSCEALRRLALDAPTLANDNVTNLVEPPADGFFQETFSFVETLGLNGTVPEEGSDAFNQILNLTLAATEEYERSLAEGVTVEDDSDDSDDPDDVSGGAVDEDVVTRATSSRFTIINHHLGFRALCDTQADRGGWTVVQRRTSGQVSFDRLWLDYLNGFGYMDNGYWLGLRKMRRLIERLGTHEVRFEFTTSRRQSKVVQYNRFSIGPELDRFRLSINALDYNLLKSTESGLSIELHNLMRFTTVDRDYDTCLLCNCAFPGRGGWWFNACLTANLNGLWGVPLFNLGPSWVFNAGLNRPLRSTLMMIRRR